MNRNEAIRAHAEWKRRLSNYLRHPDGSLDATDAERDDACELGEWIEGEGRDLFATDMAFQHLRVAHARFHHCAADLMRRSEAGRPQEGADTDLRADLAETSAEVVTSIVALPIAKASRRVASAV